MSIPPGRPSKINEAEIGAGSSFAAGVPRQVLHTGKPSAAPPCPNETFFPTVDSPSQLISNNGDGDQRRGSGPDTLGISTDDNTPSIDSPQPTRPYERPACLDLPQNPATNTHIVRCTGDDQSDTDDGLRTPSSATTVFYDLDLNLDLDHAAIRLNAVATGEARDGYPTAHQNSQLTDIPPYDAADAYEEDTFPERHFYGE